MRRIVTYIFLLAFCILTGCADLCVEDKGVQDSGSEYVDINISLAVQGEGVETRGFADDPSSDIRTLHLIVFDENGYYVEAARAEITGSNTYHVTLLKTEKKRAIHFIANCPEDQIMYGHEANVIVNMYVTKGTAHETAYWYRTEVRNIHPDSNGRLESDVAAAFENVPLLRNFASVTVNSEARNFTMESYAIYNTIDIGTVAPFDVSSHRFQKFMSDNRDTLYTYDRLTKYYGYNGHALTDAKLNSTLLESDFVSPGTPIYMYERTISVRTDDEQKWHESPAHIIIKGKYAEAKNPSYYKVDMIRNEDGQNIYYNILRNFKYVFTVNTVAGEGYATLQEAMNNPAGNNLSGATDTQKFTNISDGIGRVFVSFTDTTLVSSDNIRFKYKYIPNIQYFDDTDNGSVTVKGILDGTGSVLDSIVEQKEVEDGWREVTFAVQEPGPITHIQEIQLNVSDNINLNKTIRFRLQKPYNLDVNCNPNKIAKQAGRPMEVQLLIPDHLTEEIFPLSFAIEVKDHTLSPDASKDDNYITVEPGLSIDPDKKGKPSYYFIKTLYNIDDYKSLSMSNGKKLLYTYWVTNKAENASTVYVYNKYFNLGQDEFVNAIGFSDVAFPDGVKAETGSATRFVFNMNKAETITLTLTGLKDAAGNTVVQYTPSAIGMQEITLYTTQASGTVKVHMNGDSYEAYEIEAVQTNKITIPELVVTFTWKRSGAPSANNVTPELTVSKGNIEYSISSRNRSGSNRNYTYTITFTNVVIEGADMQTTVTAKYVNGTRTSTGSKTVQNLINDPSIKMSDIN